MGTLKKEVVDVDPFMLGAQPWAGHRVGMQMLNGCRGGDEKRQSGEAGPHQAYLPQLSSLHS